MKVTYRRAGAEDVVHIHKMETACFSRPWSYASIQYDICENEHALYIVAETDGVVAGFCGMHAMLDEGHIMNMAVMPGFRQQGIGKGLMEAVFTLSGLKYYTLEVRVTNDAAVSLYKQLGFQILGKRPNYYGDEDALIMWRGKNAP